MFLAVFKNLNNNLGGWQKKKKSTTKKALKTNLTNQYRECLKPICS